MRLCHFTDQPFCASKNGSASGCLCAVWNEYRRLRRPTPPEKPEPPKEDKP